MLCILLQKKLQGESHLDLKFYQFILVSNLEAIGGVIYIKFLTYSEIFSKKLLDSLYLSKKQLKEEKKLSLL